MKSDGEKRNWSKTVLYTICIIFFVLIGFIYVWTLNHQEERLDIGTGADNRIQVKITSKKSSKYHLSDANSQNSNSQEIEKLIEQTQSLSMDLIKQFDSDIQKADIKPDESKPYHRDYIYHGNNRQIETGICRNPYQLLVLCLDNTNTTRRNLYRQTWASEKERILTSDGMKSLDWKIVFVVDVPNGLAERAAFKEEQLRHNDVIGFWSSSSRKETLKLMASMEWVDQNCEFTFLARIKSHMFLNTPKMFSLLSDPRIPSTELYAGHVVYDSNRTTTFHSAKKTLIKGYPRFIENAYLMSFDVVDSGIRKFHWSKPHPNPDVYIGELVLQSGIDVWPLSNFISFDVREICEMRLIQDGAIIQTRDQCMRMYSKESSRLIPEI